jgi:hypothetical protein
MVCIIKLNNFICFSEFFVFDFSCLNLFTELMYGAQMIPGASYWGDQNVWNISCDVSSLPDVSFVFNGTTCSVPARLYVQTVSSVPGLLYVQTVSSAKSCPSLQE